MVQMTFFLFVLFVAPVCAEHAHRAPHGGSLSVIEGCGLGHVELKIDGERLELWFLDGGDKTDRSVPIIESGFPLSLIATDGRRVETAVTADPLTLAGEKKERCSHFVATVPGLSDLKEFTAFAWVRFKGEMRPLRIAHPGGYDPDHGAKPEKKAPSGKRKPARNHGHEHGHDDDCPDCKGE